MSELRITETMDVSARLAREVGLIAGRLARFLEASLRGSESAVADGTAFLWAMFESVAEGRPPESWSRNPLERAPAGETHPLDRLARSMSLSPEEVELLLLAGLSEEHEGLAAILRTMHPRGEPRPTVGLAAQLFCRDQRERWAFRALIETGAAARSGALRVTGDSPFFERSLQPAEALWAVLHGLDVWPPSVIRLDTAGAGSGFEEWLETADARRAVKSIRQGGDCTTLVTADNEDVAYHRAVALVAHAGAMPAGILLPAAIESETLKLIRIHSLARGATPVLKLAPVDGPNTPEPPSFGDFPGPVVACGRAGAVSARGERPLINVLIERLTPTAKRRMWREVAPALAPAAAFLAARYPVEPATAAAVAADLRFVAELEDREPTVDDVAASVRARGGVSLSAGVRMIRPHATWKDLVLHEDRLRQLREAVSRLEMQAVVFDEWGFLKDRAGARGVRLLFTGPPGTGKTLSAEVLASSLGVDLLIVDLSRVVSKWIGETEKNLASVFDAAERAQAALFFDEADALFGKRTEVSDAHDRYANLETAYLLTRLEQFEGLAILATNLRENIDPAFLRRLEFVVDFDEPDREERFAIWGRHLPEGAPLAKDVNLYELAALYPVVGGVIRNAAVAAGFLAATEGVSIDRRHFIHAIRREYEKAGRSFPGMPVGMKV
jgi:AAA+ superfamily predicted ATPase